MGSRAPNRRGGLGTFDDDNMVGATAFMETFELAVELRRAGYGVDGDERRLGFDLYPYTAVGAIKAPSCSGGSSTASRRSSTARHCARRSRRRTPSTRTSSCTACWAREVTL
jgi:hypothetical protein